MDNAMLQNLLLMQQQGGNNDKGGVDNKRPEDQQQQQSLEKTNVGSEMLWQSLFQQRMNQQMNQQMGLQNEPVNFGVNNAFLNANFDSAGGAQAFLNGGFNGADKDNASFQQLQNTDDQLRLLQQLLNQQQQQLNEQHNGLASHQSGSSNSLNTLLNTSDLASAPEVMKMNTANQSFKMGGLNFPIMGHASPNVSKPSFPVPNEQPQGVSAPQKNDQGLGNNKDQQGGFQSDPYAENGMLGPWSAASAALLGELVFSNQGKGKKTKKKPKDRPKRPLSAYNIFFKEERKRILEEIPDSQSATGETVLDANGTAKKKPHGKIGFQSLAKIVGKRWKDLSLDNVEIYKRKAEDETKRHRKEMDAYLALDSKK